MSCIAGIFNLDGAPVDRELLERMTASMASRAPDGKGLWVSGDIGLGHVLLKTSRDAENDHQPCTLDGQAWVAADARIDGQDELIRKLRSAGRRVQDGLPDAELILHAYAVFGNSFLDHLIGDFAFALWDEHKKKLICARDHLGAKPFFYFKSDRHFLFASDIDALMLHPAVTRKLDDAAVGDFLMLGNYLDEEFSIFQDIRRLPCATVLSLEKNGVLARKKYWYVPQSPELEYRQPSEYLEHFQELFGKAVNDRIRTDSIMLELSGGMDSTAIAAMAVPKIRANGNEVRATTCIYTPLLPDDREGYFAGLVAESLDIPVSYKKAADYQLFEGYGLDMATTPEPLATADLAFSRDIYRQASESGTRVFLSGFGADAVLYQRNGYYSDLLRKGRLAQLLSGLYRHWRVTGTIRGVNLRSVLFPRAAQEALPFQLHDWLNSDFVKKNQLEERWEYGWRNYLDADPYTQLNRPYWARALEGEYFKLPVEGRYPFMDVRVVEFLMGLPNFMKYDKYVTRQAMQGKLPEQILTRPKQGVAGDPVRARFLAGETRISVEVIKELVSSEYVDGKRFLETFRSYLSGEGKSTFPSYFIIQALAFTLWRKHT